MNKTWTLQLNNQPLYLALSSQGRGTCHSCLLNKEIRIISQIAKDFRSKFCQPCALERLSELAEYEVEPKEVIKEVRSSLIFGK